MRQRPIVMGIVNVTPDSFSDGGLHGDGVAHAAALIEAGVTAVIQPGGSKADDKVIAAANAAGIVMAMTGMRHFNH